jgi:hypothetical protein
LKHFVIILFFGVTSFARFSFAQSTGPLLVTVSMKDVILYESPTKSSPVVRRVFPGEVLKIIETVQVEQREIWGKVFLSPNQVAYVEGSVLSRADSLPQEMWRPPQVLRNQLPVSFAAKGTGELFGPGLQFRYLPFTRLGINLGAGSVLDTGRSKGFSVAYGLTCVLSMDNFSPFVETGTSTLTLNDGQSSLRISTFFVNVGVEWILRSGYFFGAGISYSRSYNIQVAYDFGYAKAFAGNLQVGDYGSFNGLSGSESLERLNPLFTVGYSF